MCQSCMKEEKMVKHVLWDFKSIEDKYLRQIYGYIMTLGSKTTTLLYWDLYHKFNYVSQSCPGLNNWAMAGIGWYGVCTIHFSKLSL